ncbi:MAG: cobalamin biosynthesis protein, partial [Acidimicrobiales bacterium]
MTAPLALGILAGSAADRLFGDPARAHPVAAFGRAAGKLEGWMWRDRRAAGAVYAAALVGGTALAASVLERAVRRMPLGRATFSATVVWAALGGRSLSREALEVAHALAHG